MPRRQPCPRTTAALPPPPPAKLALIALVLSMWLIDSAGTTNAQLYREYPGVIEFTGTMVARPLQVEHWRKMGFSEEQSRERHRQATEYIIETLGEHIYRYSERMDQYWFGVPEGRTENDLGEELLASGYLRYVCPNWKTYPQASLTMNCPDDEFLDEQWHLKRIEACAGWQIHSQGDDDVVLSVVDLEIRTTHEDFSTLTQYRREGYNTVEGLWESQGGTIFGTGYHGTIVAGAAAATGNNGVGTSGVGWSNRHRSIVTDGGMEETFDGMWIAAVAGDRVIISAAAMSPDLQTQKAWREESKEITLAYNVLIVQAGANEPEWDEMFEPFPDMINVGGTNSSDGRWINGAGTYGSTIGAHLDVMAPATGIYGPDWESDDGYRTSFGSGTSYSVPQAGGLCALIWAYNTSLSPAQVRDLVYAGCDPIVGYNQNLHGHGRINVFNSLALASGDLWTRDPHPGRAGEDNIFKAAGATDEATVRFYYGSATGQTAVSGCTNVYVGIANASVLGTATAASNGAAVIEDFFVPGGWAEVTVHLQAVDLSDCRVSNLITYTFPPLK